MAKVRTGNSKLIKSAGCRIDLNLTLTNGRLFARTTYKIGQVAHLLATKRWDLAFLRVRYGHGFDNAATVENYDDAIYFLNAFTESDLLGYLKTTKGYTPQLK